MIVVHHLNNSRSQRVLWLLEELGLPYEIKRYERDRQTMLAPAAGTWERLRYNYWLHFAEGSAMPPLVMKLVFDRIEKGPMPFFARFIARRIAGRVKKTSIEPNLTRQLDYMEAELRASAWFAGPDFSAADIQMSFPVEAARARGGLDASRLKLMEYLGRIHAREPYRRALERGGEFEILS